VSQERERLSWEIFGDASRALAAEIHADGFQPDIILAIARGGLLVAGALGYALSVKNLYTMNVEYYTGVDERLDVPMILPPIPDPGFLANADVLIADDVADTGHTLAAVKEFCTGKVAEVRSAVLFEKPRSVVKCEYVWKATDLWIEFPWSDKPPITAAKTGKLIRDA
jgi:hypoxanthine phosphoribosyltransferase